MHAREQYLEQVREGVSARHQAGEDSTIERGAESDAPGSQGADPKAGTSGEAESAQGQERGVNYGADVLTTLLGVWELFEFPCGQWLVAALRTEVPRVRAAGQLNCSDDVAGKLAKISASTMDRLLRREKHVRRVSRPRSATVHRTGALRRLRRS